MRRGLSYVSLFMLYNSIGLTATRDFLEQCARCCTSNFKPLASSRELPSTAGFQNRCFLLVVQFATSAEMQQNCYKTLLDRHERTWLDKTRLHTTHHDTRKQTSRRAETISNDTKPAIDAIWDKFIQRQTRQDKLRQAIRDATRQGSARQQDTTRHAMPREAQASV